MPFLSPITPISSYPPNLPHLNLCEMFQIINVYVFPKTSKVNK